MTDNSTRVILDLCGGTGNWSRCYRERGYDVRVIDPFPAPSVTAVADDVRWLHFPGPVHGILAAPPCTVFANSGARWPRTREDYLAALSVVDACLRLVALCRPAWWALENPVGKLVRWLGKPVMYFDPCDYGDPYTKRTALWGAFTPPARTPVAPTEGSRMLRFGGNRARTKRLRSATPLGFAKAFADANP
jgi:hypothetical protein